jgi:hypothetical protein
MSSIQQITEEQLATLTRQWKHKRGSHLPDRGTAPISSAEIRIASLEGTLQSIMALGNRAKETGNYLTAVKRIVGLAHEALGLPPKW